MPTMIDYLESISRLKEQAISQADRGTRQGLADAFESLRAIVRECDAALAAFPEMGPVDRGWFQNKRDEAAAQLV